MPSFVAIFEGLSKVNKFVTIVNTAFDASMLGVQIAQAVDPESVCVAWDVKGLSSKALDKGKPYDALLQQLSNVSVDLDNVRQSISNLQAEATNQQQKLQALKDISSKLSEGNVQLSQQVPSAHKWLLDLQNLKKLEGDTQTKLNAIAEALKVSGTDIAISGTLFGVSLIALVATEVYERHYRQPNNRYQLLFDQHDPKWRLKRAVSTIFGSLVAFGSFAMNIYLVIKLAQQCQNQADELNKMISHYDENTPILDALLNGCKGDPTKLKKVTAFLEGSDPGSLNDAESQKLIDKGLNANLTDYNAYLNAWATELDGLYKSLTDSINAGAQNHFPGVEQSLADKLNAGYSDLQKQIQLLNNTAGKSAERLSASREVLAIFGRTISPLTNDIVKQYQIALVDLQVQQFLSSKAQQIAKRPARLEEFNADKQAYVRGEGFLDDLNHFYPERTTFKDANDDTNIQRIAEYLALAIKDIQSPKTVTSTAPKPVNLGENVFKVSGETCPSGSTLVTYEEALANKDLLSGKLGAWDIARLAGGGSMDGPGYDSKIRAKDERGLGHALCKRLQ